MELKDYYDKQFREDLLNINFTQGGQGGYFFDGRPRVPRNLYFSYEEWIEAINKIKLPEDKVCFVFSMFITIASDQTMFTYFNSKYEEFKELTRYPKFGWKGMVSHIQNPLNIIKHPIEQLVISTDIFEQFTESAAKLFIDEVKDFFSKYIKEIDYKEFVSKFVTDPDVVHIIRRDASMKNFIDKMEMLVST